MWPQWDHFWDHFILVEISLESNDFESDTASTLVWCHRLGLHNLIIYMWFSLFQWYQNSSTVVIPRLFLEARSWHHSHTLEQYL